MKKIIAVLLACFAGGLFISVSAESEPVTATGETTLATVETSSYVYYYGRGCKYCANVDAYLEGTNGYEKLGIDKREVYFDKENSKKMTEDAARLGIVTESIGVPFLIITTDGKETFLTGDAPIIEHFTPILGEPVKSHKKTIILFVLLFMAIGVPVLLMMKK